MWTDALGNAVSVADGSSLAAIDDFVEGFIGSEARAAHVLQGADDPAPLVQAYCAALHMFAESREAAANAKPFIARAQAGSGAVTAREARFIDAVAAWIDGDVTRAIALHEAQSREFPRDLASLKLGHYHLFNRGDAPAMLRMAMAARDAAADVAAFHGMLAFAWEQCHFLEEAEAAARQAMALRHREPWAHHALAHVMLAQGRIHEGHAFLQSVGATWTGLNSFMVTHNWWHQALFAIELDRLDEALAIHDQHVWAEAKDYTQDQVNAVSLLARLELAGADVGKRWSDIGDYLLARLADQVLPFLDLQYLLGLARAGRPASARELLANIERRARHASGEEADAWQEVCVPAARGLLAFSEGDWDGATRSLGQALPRMLEIGGSHAQRDLFSQVHLAALLRSGRLAGAQNLLQQQVRAQPESLRLRRQARALHEALGLSGL